MQAEGSDAPWAKFFDACGIVSSRRRADIQSGHPFDPGCNFSNLQEQTIVSRAFQLTPTLAATFTHACLFAAKQCHKDALQATLDEQHTQRCSHTGLTHSASDLDLAISASEPERPCNFHRGTSCAAQHAWQAGAKCCFDRAKDASNRINSAIAP